jgi:hypothetical protein
MLDRENLLSVISFVSGISEDIILSQNRSRGLVLCRHVYFYIAREKLGLKLAEIGEVFGCDHTTVIHGLTKVKDMLSIQDEITCNMVDQVNLCIKEKYLIPTKIFVSIPDNLNSDEIISAIEKMGCSVENL